MGNATHEGDLPGDLHALAAGEDGLALERRPHIIEAILNHKTGTIRGVARVYNRAKYLRRKRVALDSWAAYVEQLVAQSGEDDAAHIGPRERRIEDVAILAQRDAQDRLGVGGADRRGGEG